MAEDRGDGETKHTSLQQAASIFVDVMLEGDGAGIVRFNQDAQPLQSVLPMGNGGLSDINRGATKDIINGPALNPGGQTSIGDGIFEGRGILNSTPTPFDVKSLVVLTDGVENSTRMIADVAAEINEFTYAVGLGKPQNISVRRCRIFRATMEATFWLPDPLAPITASSCKSIFCKFWRALVTLKSCWIQKGS